MNQLQDQNLSASPEVAASAGAPRVGSRQRRARWLAPLLASSAFLLTPEAPAFPEYPEIVQSELDMPCAPQCILCHLTNPGQGGNTAQPFAQTILYPINADVLRTRLQGLVDANDPAVELLREGRNPNARASEEGALCQLDTRYGCGARVEPRGPLPFTGALVTALTLFGGTLLTRRRRQRG